MSGPLTRMLGGRLPLILNGAMGTEIERRGGSIALPLWSANALISKPDLIRQIHHDYLDAGTDIIVTNTFRTNPRVFAHANLPDRSAGLTGKAVEIAHQARAEFPDRQVLIAGCMAPVEDCYRPDLVPTMRELEDEHFLLAEHLAEHQVDFMLIETMTTIREALAACKAAKATGKEVVVSFSCTKEGMLYGGEPLIDAIKAVEELQPSMFSLNCISPRYIGPLVTLLQSATSLPFAVYGNVGQPDVREGPLRVDVDAESYARFAREWKDRGAAIIGGCCGTTPEYIRRLKETLHGNPDA